MKMNLHGERVSIYMYINGFAQRIVFIEAIDDSELK